MKLKCARGRLGCALVSAGLIALDLLTKAWAMRALLPLGDAGARALPGVARFRFVWNRGAAFSLLRDHPVLVALVSAAILAAVLLPILLSKRVPPIARWAAALVFAGGAGNLVDRLRFGAVADFIEFTFVRFPVFNFADICVTAGAALFALWVFLPRAKGGERK